MCYQYLTNQGRCFCFRVVDLTRLELSIVSIFLGYKGSENLSRVWNGI